MSEIYPRIGDGNCDTGSVHSFVPCVDGAVQLTGGHRGGLWAENSIM